jgi:hypothetical protein
LAFDSLGCVHGLYVVLELDDFVDDFIALIALIAFGMNTVWFQMLFEINSIFFGITAFWG